jgi:spore coat protein U-like protein
MLSWIRTLRALQPGSGVGPGGCARACVLPAAAILWLALGGSEASAATAATTMAVSVTVQATCTVSASALTFGTYTSTVLNGLTTVSVTCTNTSPYNILLDQGGGTGATVAARKMSNGGQTLTYSLYSDTNHTLVWGATIGSNTVTGTGNGAAQSYNVYGQIPAGQAPTPGVYSDTVNVQVSY